MEKKSSGQRPVEVNSTGGQDSRRAVAPSDDDDDADKIIYIIFFINQELVYKFFYVTSILRYC